MPSRRPLFFFSFACLVGTGLVAAACSDDETSNDASGSSTSSSSSSGGGSSGSTTSSSSGGSSGSSGGGDDGGAGSSSSGGGDVEIDGGGPCGAYDFGKAAAPFGPVDTSDNVYDGGALPPGIYDAVKAERLSNAGGSWRETFAVDGKGRYTRIRQIDTGGGGGPGAIRYRSGMVTLSSGKAEITLTEECAFNAEQAADGGTSTVPYETLEGPPTVYRYGLAGFRVSLQKR